MEVTKALIHQFLENKCTKEEAERVYDFLLHNPEVLEDYLPEKEWEQFQQMQSVDAEKAGAWFKKIQRRKQGLIRSMAKSRYLRIAAAVIVLAFSTAIVYQVLRKPAVVHIVFRPAPKDTVSVTEQRLVNKTGKPVKYQLEDGSSVVLYTNSDLVFPQHFEAGKRQLTLQGEAIFYVAKDSRRPFTVFTEQFATTALGTVFRIKAYRGKKAASVQLLKGKVMVKSLEKENGPVYLLPGDECNWTPGNHPLQVIKKKTAQQKESTAVPVIKKEDNTDNELAFVNTPLTTVFEKIGQAYQTTIRFETIDLAGRKFTGTFSKDQPIEEVLSTIADLNSFKVVKEANGFSIHQP